MSSDKFNNIKSYIRDINLSMITGSYKVDINVDNRYNSRFRLFMPNQELIKYVIKIGGVITGSRAMRCYSINDKPILDRKCEDWDFIITQDMTYKICDKFGIVELYSVNDIISIRRHRWTVHPDYSESYRLGIVDVHLMIKESLPEFNESKGIKVASFNYTVNEKVKMVDSLINNDPIMCSGGYGYNKINLSKIEIDKHLDDLTQVIVKFNCI